MPKRWEEPEDLVQDWEPVTITKINSQQTTTPIVLTIGKQIRDRRRVCQMTQLKLAQAVGISPKILDKIEQDTVKPTASHMVKINRVLGCSIKY